LYFPDGLGDFFALGLRRGGSPEQTGWPKLFYTKLHAFRTVTIKLGLCAINVMWRTRQAAVHWAVDIMGCGKFEPIANGRCLGVSTVKTSPSGRCSDQVI
jgi:hypothetical protein